MKTIPLLQDKLTEELRDFILGERKDTPVRISSERELAERAGVSRVSVRRALKNLVNEGLLVQRQGSGTYIIPAPSLRNIEVLVARDIRSNDPFYSELLAEISHYCAETSRQLSVRREGSANGRREFRGPTIIVGLVDEGLVREVSAGDRLVVSTQYYPDVLEITQILFDDYRIGSEAAEILHRLGHARIVHLRGPRAYPSAEDRARGFESGATKRKMSVVTLHGKMNWRSGHDLGAEVIRMLGQPDGPTAAFASNDWMALGLMQRLAEAGIKVPAQLSIIGCDNIHMAAEIFPGLSTFKWDTAYLVRELFAVIDSEAQDGDRSHKRILLPASFVERDSTGRRGAEGDD